MRDGDTNADGAGAPAPETADDLDDLAGDDLTGNDLDDLAGDDLTGNDLTGNDLAGDDLTADEPAGDPTGDYLGDDLDAYPPDSGLTWLGGDSTLARTVGRPLARFLHIEASGGLLLLIAAAAALVWVNASGGNSYFDFWQTHVDISVGGVEIFQHDLHAFVNDAFMALFFFVVGLEIKRELVTGQLRRPRDAMLPVIGALGGMVVPALVYVAFNAGGDHLSGWGIPMATDIAFAVGLVSLVSKRVPAWLRLFLLSLAIVDDIGAILVIAIFYTESLSLPWVAVAVGLCVAVAVLVRVRVWASPVYLLMGAVIWWATYRSGIHATIAGVALGMLTPAKPLQSQSDARAVARWLHRQETVSVTDIRRANFGIAESSSVGERLEVQLHPYVSYLILPIFALANAGVLLSGDVLREAVTSPVTLGVAVGLVAGKAVGVTAFTLLAVKLRLSSLPAGVSSLHVLGAAIVAGVGFTVALFITELAFSAGAIADQARIGVLGGSLVAAVLGLGTLLLAGGPRTARRATQAGN